MILLVTDYSTHSGLFPIIYKGSPPSYLNSKSGPEFSYKGGFGHWLNNSCSKYSYR